MNLAPGDRRHGSLAGYKAGCRCDRCADANRAYTRQWRLHLHGGPRPVAPPRRPVLEAAPHLVPLVAGALAVTYTAARQLLDDEVNVANCDDARTAADRDRFLLRRGVV